MYSSQVPRNSDQYTGFKIAEWNLKQIEIGHSDPQLGPIYNFLNFPMFICFAFNIKSNNFKFNK